MVHSKRPCKAATAHTRLHGQRPIATRACSPLLDAIVQVFTISPMEREYDGPGRTPISKAKTMITKAPRKRRCPLPPDADDPLVAMAFKITEDPFGALTFMRIYQGKIEKGRHVLQPAQRSQGTL